MTGSVAVLAALAGALNPSLLAARRGDRPIGPWSVGIAIGVVAVAVMAGLAEPVRDALSVSEPTMRTAAGAALALTGARWLIGPRPGPGEADPPVDATLTAFTPAAVLTAMATATEDGWWITTLGLAAVAAVATGIGLVAARSVPAQGAGALLVWSVRAFGGLAVVAGLGLVVSGVEVV